MRKLAKFVDHFTEETNNQEKRKEILIYLLVITKIQIKTIITFFDPKFINYEYQLKIEDKGLTGCFFTSRAKISAIILENVGNSKKNSCSYVDPGI